MTVTFYFHGANPDKPASLEQDWTHVPKSTKHVELARDIMNDLKAYRFIISK